ncbi:hypothetical protein PINS_up019055 [Pythium insidiosum]|nr:hypothetical protein PINS_up019055 [Pythium insidiosum]
MAEREEARRQMELERQRQEQLQLAEQARARRESAERAAMEAKAHAERLREQALAAQRELERQEQLRKQRELQRQESQRLREEAQRREENRLKAEEEARRAFEAKRQADELRQSAAQMQSLAATMASVNVSVNVGASDSCVQCPRRHEADPKVLSPVRHQACRHRRSCACSGLQQLVERGTSRSAVGCGRRACGVRCDACAMSVVRGLAQAHAKVLPPMWDACGCCCCCASASASARSDLDAYSRRVASSIDSHRVLGLQRGAQADSKVCLQCGTRVALLSTPATGGVPLPAPVPVFRSSGSLSSSASSSASSSFSSLPTTKRCSSCGADCKYAAKFCVGCGFNFAKADEDEVARNLAAAQQRTQAIRDRELQQRTQASLLASQAAQAMHATPSSSSSSPLF